MKVIKEKKKLIVLISVIVIAILIGVGVAVNATGSSGGIAKSVTFSENMDGAYVYFRAVDAAGNVGEWSEPQRLWIDTTAPIVTAKESSVTIKEGNVNVLADYFTVVANGTNSDVDVVCTIGGTTYTTTETLTVEGSPYTVVCTATKSGGNSGSAEMEIVVESAAPPPWDGTVATGFAGGQGTLEEPYIIETPQQLAYLAKTVNDGTRYSDKYLKIVNDLDLGGVQAEDGTWSGPEWIPIGGLSTFGGNLDGNGYLISNLYIDDSEGSFGAVGLFGNVSDAITYVELEGIRNITIESGYVRGGNKVGGVAGYADNRFENCYNYASVSGESYVGGLFGSAIDFSEYINCYNYGNISGSDYVGGIIGSGTIYWFENCYNYGNVSGSDYVGGIIGRGYDPSPFTHCSNYGDITGNREVRRYRWIYRNL